MVEPLPTEGSTPMELQRRIHAERDGEPFLVLRSPGEEQRIVALGEAVRLTIGRGAEVDIGLDHDAEVSRVHAALERLGGGWILSDDGLSRNGSYVNGERISGRRRLHDGDIARFGNTPVLFRAPAGSLAGETRTAAEAPDLASITPAQRRVLVALCRPFKDTGAFAIPATNREIAEQLFLSVDAVKGHLRALFAVFGVDQLPQTQKRMRLVERALGSGAVATEEL